MIEQPSATSHAQAIDLPALLQDAVEEAARLLHADGATIYLIEPGAEIAHWCCDAGIQDSDLREGLRRVDLPAGQGMIGRAIESGLVQVTLDFEHDPDVSESPPAREAATALGLRSVVVAPMLGEREPHGTLSVFTCTARTFSDSDLALIRALADHAALAIDNARLNQELIASDERHRFLLQHSPDGIWSSDARGRFTFVSDSAEALVGWKPAQLIGRTWDVVLHESTRDEVAKRIAAQYADPSLEQLYRCNLRHRDGRAVPVEIHAVGIDQKGRLAGAHGSVRDMRQHDRIERDLRGQAAELAAGEERALLAQELHDSVTQALFSMTLTARSAEILLRKDPDAAAERLEELRGLAQEALAEMRSLIFELRPGSLAEEGLAAAIRKHVAAVRGRTGLPVVVEVEPPDGLGLPAQEALYRIAQEALHNVIKHASASRARIALCSVGGAVRLTVEDDGVGFDPDAVSRDRLGLAGMRTRAARLRGRFTVTSSPGAGTRIDVTLPLTSAE